MTYILLSSFEKEDGSIDWAGYQKAKIDNGERCYQCSSFILFANGYKRLCARCNEMQSIEGMVTHNNRVRCPKCRKEMGVQDYELYELYEEGEHLISCQNCDCDFNVETEVNYTFKSPELLREEDNEEDDEE